MVFRKIGVAFTAQSENEDKCTQRTMIKMKLVSTRYVEKKTRKCRKRKKRRKQTTNKMKCIENELHKTVICMQNKWQCLNAKRFTEFSFLSFSVALNLFSFQMAHIIVHISLTLVKWMKIPRSEIGWNEAQIML